MDWGLIWELGFGLSLTWLDFFTIYRGISNGTLGDITHKKGVHGQITLVNAALKQVNQNIYLTDDQSL